MKKLTDKIYIAESNSHPGFFAQEYFLPYRWKKFNSIEYIRKDALLEWAKEQMTHYQHAGNGIGWGQWDTFRQVIAKIESL